MPDVVNNPAPNNPAPAAAESKTEAAQEILSLLPEKTVDVQQPGNDPNQHAQEPKTVSPLPYPELPGLGTDWLPTTDEAILNKKHTRLLDHTRLLAQGVKVEDIEHPGKYAVYACGQGCQCAKCKTKRNERRIQASAGSDPLANPKAVGTFLSEKFFGRVLCLPNETMKAVCRFKHYPKEAEECWNVPNEDIKVYEDFGKFVMENYLHLEDNKHAQLAAFSIWYLGKLAITGATMNAILSKDHKK